MNWFTARPPKAEPSVSSLVLTLILKLDKLKMGIVGTIEAGQVEMMSKCTNKALGKAWLTTLKGPCAHLPDMAPQNQITIRMLANSL
jgi:hypothetical protein